EFQRTVMFFEKVWRAQRVDDDRQLGVESLLRAELFARASKAILKENVELQSAHNVHRQIASVWIEVMKLLPCLLGPDHVAVVPKYHSVLCRQVVPRRDECERSNPKSLRRGDNRGLPILKRRRRHYDVGPFGLKPADRFGAARICEQQLFKRVLERLLQTQSCQRASRKSQRANRQRLASASNVTPHARAAWRILTKVPDKFVEAAQVVGGESLGGTNARKRLDLRRRGIPQLRKLRMLRRSRPHSRASAFLQRIQTPRVEHYPVDQQRRGQDDNVWRALHTSCGFVRRIVIFGCHRV